jgi:hypothetical protein
VSLLSPDGLEAAGGENPAAVATRLASIAITSVGTSYAAHATMAATPATTIATVGQ